MSRSKYRAIQNILFAAEGKMSALQLMNLNKIILQMVELTFEMKNLVERDAWLIIEDFWSLALVRATQLYLKSRGADVEVIPMPEAPEVEKGNTELVEQTFEDTAQSVPPPEVLE